MCPWTERKVALPLISPPSDHPWCSFHCCLFSPLWSPSLPCSQRDPFHPSCCPSGNDHTRQQQDHALPAQLFGKSCSAGLSHPVLARPSCEPGGALGPPLWVCPRWTSFFWHPFWGSVPHAWIAGKRKWESVCLDGNNLGGFAWGFYEVLVLTTTDKPCSTAVCPEGGSLLASSRLLQSLIAVWFILAAIQYIANI